MQFYYAYMHQGGYTLINNTALLHCIIQDCMVFSHQLFYTVSYTHLYLYNTASYIRVAIERHI